MKPAPQASPSPAKSSQTVSTSTKRLFVGNLSWSVDSAGLQEHMSSCGTVISCEILRLPDGRSKGCGIVEFETTDSSLRAVRELNNTDLSGRQIFVREDREDPVNPGPKPRPPRAKAGSSGQPEANGTSRSVYVGNLSYDVAWQDLKDHMRQAGEVVYVEIMALPDGRSKGCGTVQYATAQQAKNAIATLNNTDLSGRSLFVREDREGNKPANNGGGAAAVPLSPLAASANASPANVAGQANLANAVGGVPAVPGGGSAAAAALVAAAPPVGGAPAAIPPGGGLAVYVGNLTYETSWQVLKDHMRAAGNVEKADILRGRDGRSRGCGIVVYQQRHEAARAIRELQDTELNGRPIFVREDREAGGGGGRNRGPKSGKGGGGDTFRPPTTGEPGSSLFVGNMSWQCGWQELKDHFRQEVGEVERCDVPPGGPGFRSKGYGFVRFATAEQAEAALNKLNGTEFMGRELDIKLDKHN